MIFGPAIEHIKENLRSELCVEDLASQVGFSPDELEKTFQKYFHMSHKDYIVKTRLDFACHQLIETEDSIETVALRLGFTDESKFLQVFEESKKISPAKYRQNYA